MPDARAEYERALADHLSTWGPYCGAPRAVYAGHLNKLLEAHAAMVRSEGYRAGLEAAAEAVHVPVMEGNERTAVIRAAARIRALPVPKEKS